MKKFAEKCGPLSFVAHLPYCSANSIWKFYDSNDASCGTAIQMSVSFRQLYERSRYVGFKALNDEEDKRRQEQNERFSGGMIGFALEHDAAFRTHFLEKICKLDHKSVSSPDWEIWVESKNWSDLLLTHSPDRIFVVVELKIGASLAPHQNPASDYFNYGPQEGQRAGYGWEIRKFLKEGNWERAIYVTVQTKPTWKYPVKPETNMVYVAAEWKQFLKETQESKMEADLYDTLAQFDLTIFLARKMKNKSLAKQATEPFDLLKGVLAKFNIDFHHRRLKSAEHGSGAFGFNIFFDDLLLLQKKVESLENVIGWFGYESSLPKGPRLSVWLYCGSSRAAKDLRSSLIESSGYVDRQFDEDGTFLNIFLKGDESTDDMEWFVKFLSNFETGKEAAS